MKCWYQQQEDGRGDQGQMPITRAFYRTCQGGRQAEEDPSPDPRLQTGSLGHLHAACDCKPR